MKRLLARYGLCGLCGLFALGAQAQPLQDPTRPPSRLLPASAGAQADSAPQLQSILIGRAAGGRQVAVIDGDTVRVGDLVRGARVVSMTATTVQLQRGGKREVLTLTAPAVPDQGNR
jgi:MSHA biogenesis protein MshK